ncbi:MAG: phosphotransferase [Rhodocyclaceae bacterium]|nr:phosphotransferase [Rhodocyclaceae bacterium]
MSSHDQMSAQSALPREQEIRSWLARHAHGKSFALTLASADASFRRYWRVLYDDGRSAIVMDAPPTQEDVRPWLRVRELFAAAGVSTPAVFAADLERGLLLLSDFGDLTFLGALKQGADADDLYRRALSELIKLQCASRAGVLPDYDRAALLKEMQLFPEWYLARHLGLCLDDEERNALARVFDAILAVNLAEPRVFVHRDYHSRNLMACGDVLGVIDFQDAVYGPLSYDLVSLLKDAYIAWEEDITLDWLIRYWQEAKRAGLPVATDFGEFYRAYEWMGVQRHIKVLGIFARLWHRDGKNAYLADMPRVFTYLHRAARRYGALTPLARLLERIEGHGATIQYTF